MDSLNPTKGPRKRASTSGLDRDRKRLNRGLAEETMDESVVEGVAGKAIDGSVKDQDVPSSATSLLLVGSNLDDEIDGISQLYKELKLTRQEKEEQLIRDKKWVKQELCNSCSAWISKESKACKICGRGPRPSCSCGATVAYGPKCGKCQKSSCEDWLERNEEDIAIEGEV